MSKTPTLAPCGTETRYRQHVRLHELVDPKCAGAHTDACRAARLLSGHGRGVNVSASLLALLVGSAPIEVRLRVVRELGARTVSAVIRVGGRDGR